MQANHFRSRYFDVAKLDGGKKSDNSDSQKFVARKSKKYLAQDGHLCLPGLEFAYVLNSLVLAPRYALFDTHLIEIDNVLAKLREKHEPTNASTAPDGWWDGALDVSRY